MAGAHDARQAAQLDAGLILRRRRPARGGSTIQRCSIKEFNLGATYRKQLVVRRSSDRRKACDVASAASRWDIGRQANAALLECG